MATRFIVFSVLLALGGCGRIPIAPTSATLNGQGFEYDQNYRLGEKRKAAVGDAVVKVRDYYAIRTSVLTVVPTESVTLIAPSGTRSPTYASGQAYWVRGRVMV